MVRHLFPEFLEDATQYTKAVEYWVGLWEQIDLRLRARHEWRQPWLSSNWQENPVFRDGNPIFSAYSPITQKGIRIIQHPPSSPNLEFEHWLDTFGGPLTDSEAIRELVIACALSEEASIYVLERMRDWVCGDLSDRFQQQSSMGDPFIQSFPTERVSNLLPV